MPNHPRKFSKVVNTCIYLLLIFGVLSFAFPKLYEIKTKSGIDILPKYHAGTFLQKHTHGLFKCQWLYPYHCHPD